MCIIHCTEKLASLCTVFHETSFQSGEFKMGLTLLFGFQFMLYYRATKTEVIKYFIGVKNYSIHLKKVIPPSPPPTRVSALPLECV